ncbi:iron-sulfur cluster assembly protein SufD-like isoform X2 [Clytia hemisphaerica]|uniref:Uncharacterized protein n=1 Tax=Clytia hemisphaerica TaxID=252671 RepID=A0A7M5UQC3_9CNID
MYLKLNDEDFCPPESDTSFGNSSFSKMKKTIVFRKRRNNKRNNTEEKVSEEKMDDNMLRKEEEEHKNPSAFDDDFVTGKMSSSSSFEDGVEEAKEVNGEGVNGEGVNGEGVNGEGVMRFNNVEQNEEENDEGNSDESTGLISHPKPLRQKKTLAMNKAAAFVRNRAKNLRKKNNSAVIKTNDNIVKKSSSDTTVNSSSNREKNNYDKFKDLRWKQSRYLWQNARKRMNYVVGFIRKKDDDECLLIEERQKYDFANSRLEVTRRHSFSGGYESTTIDRDENSNTAMNFKYLSPQGKKLQDSHSRLSSAKTSRRSSLDSGIGPINSFLSQKYLKKSQSNYSMSSMGASTDTQLEKQQENFEECYFHPTTTNLKREGSFESVENMLYDSTESVRFDEHPSEKTEQIIQQEVDNYFSPMNNFGNVRKNSESFDFHSNNIKHASSFSYSVNDLYDLLNKENKLKNFEAHFDDLVV